MITQNNNRVKAIKNRFENLNESSGNSSEQSKKITFKNKIDHTTSSSLKQLCKQETRHNAPSCSHIPNNRVLNNECTKNESNRNINNKVHDRLLQMQEERIVNKLFQNQNQSDSSSSDEVYGTSLPYETFENENLDSVDRENKDFEYPEKTDKVLNNNNFRLLSRQCSDPGRKLQRSHAFRCDRSQKISPSPKRHSFCHGRLQSEMPTLKIGEKPRISKEKLRKLGQVLEDRMRRENFVPTAKLNNSFEDKNIVNMDTLDGIQRTRKVENADVQDMNIQNLHVSLPDDEVPQHILDQYAKVLKPKKKHLNNDTITEISLKQDPMTDSGVSSETENVVQDNDVPEKGRVNLKKLRAQFEGLSENCTEIKEFDIQRSKKQIKKPLKKTNRIDDDIDAICDDKENSILNSLHRKSDELHSSTDTIKRLEIKNPHIVLTDTLKKALKQPLPTGPPPKKPPRTFANAQSESLPNSPLSSPRPLCKLANLHEESPTTKKPKKDSKLMLEKIERALKKHTDLGVMLSPRSNNNIDVANEKNLYDIVEGEVTNDTDQNNKENRIKDKKEIHYMCTELLDLPFNNEECQNNVGSKENNSNLSNSFTKCLNSLNCGIMTTRSSSSIAYARLSSASASSSNCNSLTSICCACNGENVDNIEDVTVENKNKFSTFFNFKCPSEDSIDLCQKCGINMKKNDKFQCHLGCRCDSSNEGRNHNITLSDDMKEEHIYAEPYVEMLLPNSGETDAKSVIQTTGWGVGVKSIQNDSGMVARTSDDIIGNAVEFGGSGKRRSVRDILKKWEGGDENNCSVIKESQSFHCLSLSDNVRSDTGLKCLADTGFSKSLDVQSPCGKGGLFYESTQIYDIPCDDDNLSTRSSTPDLDSNPYSLIDEHSTRSLIHTFSGQPTSTPERKDTSKRTTHDRELRTQRKSLTPERPQVTPRNGVMLLTNDTKVLNLKQASDRRRSRTPDFDSKNGVKVPKTNLNLRAKLRSPDKNTEFDKIKLSLTKRFATEGKSAKKESRYEKRDGFKTVAGNRRPDSVCLEARSSKKSEISNLFRKSGYDRSQLDIDRDNLNRLMNEIYETVSAACVEGAGSREAAAMIGRDQGDVSSKPAKFPVDTGNDTSSEDSIKLTRSLTERRKNYVRRVSSRAAYAEPNTQTVGRVPVGRAYRHQTSVACAYDSGTPYATFRSWKSFKQEKCMSKSDGDFASGDMDADVSDGTAVGIDSGTGGRTDRLYEMCLLVGLNHITGQAYIKSVFPEGTQSPPQIENLIFPETVSVTDESLTSSPLRRRAYDLDASHTQCYSLVLTNERGERAFGYCRRVLPEGASFCLPLAYCVVSRYRAPGFFYKILQELESHHGSSELVLDSILQQLLDTDFPDPGESITLSHVRSPKRNSEDLHKNSLFRNSVNLGDVLKSKTLADPSRCIDGRKESSEYMLEQFGSNENRFKSHIPEFYNIENNNNLNCHRKVAESKSVEIPRGPRQEVRTIKRPIEPRMDDDNLSVLMDSISVSLLVKIFGTLLLERKVVLVSDKLSQLSSCMEALQSILYPFVWQHTLISTIPSGLRRDILEAPIPILAGVLRAPGSARENPDENVDDGWDGDLENVRFEEGMLVDLSPKSSSSKIIFMQGDESTILPSQSYKNLKTSLHLESSKNFSAKTEKSGQNGARYRSDDQIEKTRNVLVAEAFLRFFVDLLGNYWQYFSVSARKHTEEEEGDSELNVVFEKENFIKSTPTKHIQYFLEWFTETAMFNHFVENMAKCCPHRRNGENERVLDYALIDGLIDLPFPNFYEAFDERATRRMQKQNETGKKGSKSDTSVESGGAKTNFKHKLKVWKNKLKEFAN